MTLSELLTEWSRILEDPQKVRFTEELFYEGFNQAMEYICQRAPRKVLRDIEEVKEEITTATAEFDLPTVPESDIIRITAITLGTDVTNQNPCIEIPLAHLGLLRNKYYSSTDSFPRYVRKNNKIQFLHTVTSGLILRWYYIKKPRDVSATQTAIDIPLNLHRVALRMAVDFARWEDEQITREEMMNLWEAEMNKLIQMTQLGEG